MGKESDYSIEVMKRAASDLCSTLQKIGINEFGFYLPVSERFAPGYMMHLRQ
jgi:hypothetical protein